MNKESTSKWRPTEEKEVQTDTDTESDRDTAWKGRKNFKVVEYEKSSVGQKFNPVKNGKITFNHTLVTYLLISRQPHLTFTHPFHICPTVGKQGNETNSKEETTSNIAGIQRKSTSKIHYCSPCESDDSDGSNMILSQAKLHARNSANEGDKGKALEQYTSLYTST